MRFSSSTGNGQPTLGSNAGVYLYQSERGGIKIQLDSPEVSPVISSPVWEMAGFAMQFLQLAPGARVNLDQRSGRNYVKVIKGSLSNINRGPFTAPRTVRNALVTEDYIEADKDGAIVFIMLKTAGAPETVNDMIADDVEIKGVSEEALNWNRVDELDWGREVFKGVPFYNMRAFQIVDGHNKEICYVQFWAAGEGVDCKMHKHETAPTAMDPTYCEVHLGLFNGTGQGGMVDENGKHYVMGEGDEHGPFWKIDTNTGRPLFRNNGAVWYEDHKWQAGGKKVAAKNYDIWAVFEMAPDEAVVDMRTLSSNLDLHAINSFKNEPTVLKLACQIQPYAWGDKSYIPDLLGIDNSEGRPYAEMWIGAHPKAPAKTNIENTEVNLNDLVNAAPEEILGTDIAQKFNNELPYLLKILASEKPLSIQAHPNKQQAEAGFEKENRSGVPIDAPNRNYRDANHKPEIIVAETVFYALNGFRPLKEIAELLITNEAFKGIMPDFNERLVVAEKEGTEKELLKELYTRIMNMPQDEVDTRIGGLVDGLRAQDFVNRNEREYWVLRADDEFTKDGHRDRGIFSIYLLNLVPLNPGQGMYLDAGELHAYLEGVGIECMANSDNVLRGGLTPKHVDVTELLNTLTFNSGKPKILEPERSRRATSLSAQEGAYKTPVGEFALSVINVGDYQDIYENTTPHSADAILALSGGIDIETDKGSLRLSQGDSVIIPAAITGYKIRSTRSGGSKLYKVSIPFTLSSNHELIQAQVEFVKFAAGEGITGIKLNRKGGAQSDKGLSFLDVESPDYYFRGANPFNYKAIQRVIVDELMKNKAEFKKRQDGVCYVMNHGFMPTPENLTKLVRQGVTDGRIHDTFFPQDNPYIPGSEQFQQTGGHYQGNNFDVKCVTEGIGLQVLIWIDKENKLRTTLQLMAPGKWVYALPGTSDVVVNLGGLRFNDISFKVDEKTEANIRSEFNISEGFNREPMLSLPRAGCMYAFKKPGNADKDFYDLYAVHDDSLSVSPLEYIVNQKPIIKGVKLDVDLIRLYQNPDKLIALSDLYTSEFAIGMSERLYCNKHADKELASGAALTRGEFINRYPTEGNKMEHVFAFLADSVLQDPDGFWGVYNKLSSANRIVILATEDEILDLESAGISEDAMDIDILIVGTDLRSYSNIREVSARFGISINLNGRHPDIGPFIGCSLDKLDIKLAREILEFV